MISINFASAFVSPLLAPVAIAVILGLVLFFWGLKSLRESKIVAQIPETPVNSISAGAAHVHGKAAGDDVLLSPVTGVPCYYYKTQVEKLVKQGDQERWETFKNESGQRNFYIEDGSGRVLIDLQGAEFDLRQSLQAEIGPKSNHSCFLDPSLGLPRPNENQLHATLLADWQQARAAVQSMGIPGAKAVDKVLATGQKMASWGVQMNVDGVSINPGGVGESYRLRETCLLAGHEYSVVGTCEKDEHDAKIIRKGTGGKTFLISLKSGEQLVSKLHLQGIIMASIGVVMIVAAIAFAAVQSFSR